MELMGAIMAWKRWRTLPHRPATDSQYVRQGITEWMATGAPQLEDGWRRRGQNRDLWERLLRPTRHKVECAGSRAIRACRQRALDVLARDERPGSATLRR